MSDQNGLSTVQRYETKELIQQVVSEELGLKSLSDQQKYVIGKLVFGQIAAWIGALSALVAILTYLFGDLALNDAVQGALTDESLERISQKPQFINSVAANVQDLPEDAVLMVRTETCPDGWAPFAEASGKFVLASGIGDSSFTTANPLQTGGRPTVTLTRDNLPSHNHGIYYSLKEQGDKGLHWHDSVSGGNLVASPSPRGDAQRPNQGQSEEFAIIPPFVALQFCQLQK